MIPKSDWEWYGTAGHLCVGRFCQFHLCTLVGPWLVSTVGEYVPDAMTRELFAKFRGIELQGKGDERYYDWMNKNGFEEIGYMALYETMVFRAGAPCTAPECNCGMPELIGSDLDCNRYKRRDEATKGHVATCEKWAAISAAEVSKQQQEERETDAS